MGTPMELRGTKDGPTAGAAMVLIVDDDPFIRLIARDALETIGLRVMEASDGASGLSAMATLIPDIVLLDIVMPDMSGFEVCRQALRIAGVELPPILMLTGLDDSDSINEAYAAGATDFISKPVNWEILGHRIRYILKAANLSHDVNKSELQMANAQRMTGVGSWEWRVAQDLLIWSAEMYRICAVEAESVAHNYQGFLALVHPVDRQLVATALRNALNHGNAYDIEHRLVRPDGTERVVHGKADVLFDASGKAVSMSGMLQDITQRKRAEARINHLANYDAMTNLPNRNLLTDRLAQSISLTRRTRRQLTMFCLDLDGFQLVNDSFGRNFGDTLLKSVATRLKKSVRECDTVARLEGGEFALILVGQRGSVDVTFLAQRVLDLFVEPFSVATQTIHVTASIGVSLFPVDGDTGDTLLKNADVAMHSAKEKGRNSFQFYEQEMSLRIEHRMAMESALRAAVERQQFEVYYQPKIDLCDGTIIGVEALVRWDRPGHGMVPPDSFIGLAEETGLIVPIGEWVLRAACTQLSKWHDMGFNDLSVAVNLSAGQFGRQNIAHMVRRALAETGLAAHHLELELTESILMSDSDAMLKELGEIKGIGVVLTLDDFGTGYSSLSYLKRFPIDVVKIDRSFIRDVTTDPDDATLTKSIILLAHALRMKTVAEGVETQGQLGFLCANNCDSVQGYYFSPPVVADALSALLQSAIGLPLIPAKGPDRTVLLVDDEPHILSALARLLRGSGYRILQTTTVSEAFELLAIHDVQVIISDQRMPLMKGTAFLSKVKELHPDTIRIILSGYTELTSVIEAVNCGAVYRFYTKPWDDQFLRDQLREAFEHHWLIYGKSS